AVGMRLLLASIALMCSTMAWCQHAKESVFKLYVKSKSAPSVYIEGSAFVIASDGPPDNPHLYFLTSAHNFFPSDQRAPDPTALEDVSEIKVQYATAGFWPVDTREVELIDKWDSQARDVALFRIRSSGRRVIPLMVQYAIPSDPLGKHFV